ncbi:MAG: hypothetical protein K2F63_01995, partial [Muribaculaceae bacterium]|nr:hypothetical protein [Muribaculaceae bacterium]
AEEVVLKGSFIHPKELLRTEIGTISKSAKVEMEKHGDMWTYTTDVLPSEFYTYYYEVDDRHFVDPMNPVVVRDIADSLSCFVIQDGIADDYITRNVPHGVIKKVWYPSTLNGMKKRRMSVYVPAAYNSKGQQRFPVLYLLHGSGGDEDAWEGCGRVVQILDNLIADGRCEPMIVIMPNGNAELAAAPGSDPKNPDQKPSAVNTNSMLGKIESVFMDEVVDYVDENYRTINDKAHRAIAGISLGGLHALFISMNNPDKFDYVGLFSAQTTNALNDKRIESIQKIGEVWNELKSNLPFIGGGRVDKTISSLTSDDLNIYDDVDNKLKAQFSTPPKLYYIAVGQDDFVKKLNDDLRLKFDDNGYRYFYNETDGGHTWENWRKYLVDFLPRIFK